MDQGLVTNRIRTGAFQMHGLDFHLSDRDFGNPVPHAANGYVRGRSSRSTNPPIRIHESCRLTPPHPMNKYELELLGRSHYWFEKRVGRGVYSPNLFHPRSHLFIFFTFFKKR